MSQWRQGTVRVTNGSAVVVGDGTDWINAGFLGGEVFSLDSSGVPYVVAGPATSLGSPTQFELTLTSAYGGPSASGQDYAITTSITPNDLPYPEFGDIDTPTILKEAMLLIDARLGASVGVAASAGRVLFTDASGNLTTEAALAYNSTTDTLTAVNLSSSGTAALATLTVSANTTLGDASGDALTFNASTLAIPNGLNVDSNTLFLDASNDRVVVGHSSSSAATGATTANGAVARAQVHALSSAGAVLIADWSNDSSAPATLIAAKSKGGAVGTFGVNTLASGNDLAAWWVYGDDGTDFALAGRELWEVDGTIGSNDMPGRWTLSTTPDGTQVPVDRVRVDSTGSVILNQSGSALATNATGGFTYPPTSAGTPTGVPSSVTGAAALQLDSTNEHLNGYLGGAWKVAPLGSFVAAASAPVVYGANVGPQVGSPTGVSILQWLQVKNTAGATRWIPLFG